MRPPDRSSRQESGKKRRLLSEVSDAGCRYEVDRRRRSRGAGTADGTGTEPQLPAPDSGHYEVASDRGAAGWARIASLLETCKLNQVDSLAWTTDVLTKLVNSWPACRIDELMPWAYAKRA
jgi:hypothetical protein